MKSTLQSSRTEIQCTGIRLWYLDALRLFTFHPQVTGVLAMLTMANRYLLLYWKWQKWGCFNDDLSYWVFLFWNFFNSTFFWQTQNWALWRDGSGSCLIRRFMQIFYHVYCNWSSSWNLDPPYIIKFSRLTNQETTPAGAINSDRWFDLCF